MIILKNISFLLMLSFLLFFSCGDNSTEPETTNNILITESQKDIISLTVKEGYPDRNFYDAEILETGQQIAGDGRGILYFNIDKYTSTTNNVYLELYNNYGDGHSNSGVTNIYMIISNWSEKNISWNIQPNYSSKIWSTQVISNTNGWVLFDISAIFKAWKSGTENYGMMIDTEGSGYAPGKYSSSNCRDKSKIPSLQFKTNSTIKIVDATIKDGYPNRNFGDSEILETGKQIAGDGRGLIKFDLSSYQNRISRAYLKLYNNYGSGHNSNGITKIYRVTSTWNESTVTWNTQPNFSTQVRATKSIANSNGWVTFDITDLFNSWISGTSNYGIMIDTEGDGYSPGKYSSSENSDINKRPIVEINN